MNVNMIRNKLLAQITYIDGFSSEGGQDVSGKSASLLLYVIRLFRHLYCTRFLFLFTFTLVVLTPISVLSPPFNFKTGSFPLFLMHLREIMYYFYLVSVHTAFVTSED